MKNKKQLGFIIDLNKCTGCQSCEIACKQENGVAAGIRWRKVHTVNREHYPAAPTYRFSLACNHCDEPECRRVCPAGAYTKRPEDGIVLHDKDKCLGCRYCTWACPYGAPQYNPVTRKAEKCDFCAHLIDAGREPACIQACPTGALQIADCGGAAEPALSETIPGFPAARTRPAVRFKVLRRTGEFFREGR
ncbi:MAG: 4Fe-4S dicluster domain-containing protein [bacterium]|jgi:DMSO reductase iron-sulfur subunit